MVVGIGGLGREVLDLVSAVNASRTTPAFDLLGSIDDRPSRTNLTRLDALGTPYLGTVDDWVASGRNARFVVGIAHPEHRSAVDERMLRGGAVAATLVHPSATLGAQVRLGEGALVCAGARLTTNIVLGRHVHVHVNATIGHDTTLEDFVSVYPAGAVSGSCHLGRGATVGAHATVLQGLTVGELAFVGAGAVVTRDVDGRTVVKGLPAR